jgi:hypothetical protein
MLHGARLKIKRFLWRKRHLMKLKKTGAVTQFGVKPKKVRRPEDLAWDEGKALEKFLGKKRIRKTEDGCYYIE